jgi:hypothetical protein
MIILLHASFPNPPADNLEHVKLQRNIAGIDDVCVTFLL